MSVSWDKLCRLCANVDNCDSFLFNSDGEKKGILQFIEKILCNTISPSDGLPSKVCLDCTNKVTDFQNYIAQCEKIQLFFKKHNQFTTQLVSEEHLHSLKYEFISTESPFDVNQTTHEVKEVPIEIKKEIYDDDDLDTDHFTAGSLEFVPLSELVERSNRKVLRSSRQTKVTKKRTCKRRKVAKLKDEIKQEEDAEDQDEDLDNDCKDDANFEIVLKKNNRSKIRGVYKTKKQRINHSIFKYCCHICSEEHTYWNSLKFHVKMAHKSKPKALCICNKYLTSYKSLLNHSSMHSPNNGFKCPSCDRTFPYQRDLDRHSMQHIPKEELPFVCCKCAKRFATARILKVHERTHQPKEERYVFSCDLCDNKFITKAAVVSHKRVIHEKLKPFICDLCGHAFSTKANMEEHRVRHLDIKSFVCDACQKGFKTKGSLVRHLDTHSDTAYQCPHCPMLLNSRRTLRNHMYVHDDTAAHVCPFCSKAFKRRKECKSHLKLHTGERPYQCPWCPRTFTNGSNCRIHKRRMHPNEFAIAETNNPYAPVTKPEPKKILHASFRNPTIDKITFMKNKEAASKSDEEDNIVNDNI